MASSSSESTASNAVIPTQRDLRPFDMWSWDPFQEMERMMRTPFPALTAPFGHFGGELMRPKSSLP